MQKSVAERNRLKLQAMAYSEILNNKANPAKSHEDKSDNEQSTADFVEPEGEIDYTKYTRKSK